MNEPKQLQPIMPLNEDWIKSLIDRTVTETVARLPQPEPCKLLWKEAEAAKVLGTAVATLSGLRKRGLITPSCSSPIRYSWSNLVLIAGQLEDGTI